MSCGQLARPSDRREHPDDKIIGSLDPILGGPGWQRRLDPNMKPVRSGSSSTRRRRLRPAITLYRPKIAKSMQNCPHFFLAYATKDQAELKAFREIDYRPLRAHARARPAALPRKRQTKSGTQELFAEFDAGYR